MSDELPIAVLFLAVGAVGGALATIARQRARQRAEQRTAETLRAQQAQAEAAQSRINESQINESQLAEARLTAARLIELQGQLSSLRHDLRGILSPSMLIADRLTGHEDAAVRRAGEVIVRSVERAAARLAETRLAHDEKNSAQL
jgi:hypothetical protein